MDARNVRRDGGVEWEIWLLDSMCCQAKKVTGIFRKLPPSIILDATKKPILEKVKNRLPGKIVSTTDVPIEVPKLLTKTAVELWWITLTLFMRWESHMKIGRPPALAPSAKNHTQKSEINKCRFWVIRVIYFYSSSNQEENTLLQKCRDDRMWLCTW